MTADTMLAAEAAIIRTMNRYFIALDNREFETMTGLITPTCIWFRAGVELKGPEGLLGMTAKRPANRHSRHTLTNHVVDFIDPDTAKLTFYCIAWVHVGETDEKGVSPSSVPNTLGEWTARYVRRGDSWLLDDLRSVTAFRKVS
ncbi:nuclear transport factor 2 family protein [Neorhizobium alkalisoli]|uniref:SnoaL-like protein n=1 Tax=Neorhizobium alkalisoli TaxID=528178 RepID=A0A561QAM9_9HYPH|nr:nuclear transport factor 2 family protein [Neorhizobium alkalisoli]TWF47424.1 SnoaL-like protein [Neorhizobium alkalisoli]